MRQTVFLTTLDNQPTSWFDQIKDIYFEANATVDHLVTFTSGPPWTSDLPNMNFTKLTDRLKVNKPLILMSFNNISNDILLGFIEKLEKFYWD
jgi:hypothetical protein